MASSPPYSGPHAIEGIRFRAVREAVGVSSWGMNVIELDAGCTNYPEHHHQKDEQEEVYVILSGTAVLHVGGQQLELTAGTLARVGPNESRKLVTHDEPAVVLALGGNPGKAYTPSMGG